MHGLVKTHISIALACIYYIILYNIIISQHTMYEYSSIAIILYIMSLRNIYNYINSTHCSYTCYHGQWAIITFYTLNSNGTQHYGTYTYEMHAGFNSSKIVYTLYVNF